MRRAKERIERVQLLTASARERATELAQKYESSPLGRRRHRAQRRRRMTHAEHGHLMARANGGGMSRTP